jgi:hypothetical protein
MLYVIFPSFLSFLDPFLLKELQSSSVREIASGLNSTPERHKTENSKQIFTEKELHSLIPISTFIYSHDRPACSAAGKYVDPVLGI